MIDSRALRRFSAGGFSNFQALAAVTRIKLGNGTKGTNQVMNENRRFGPGNDFFFPGSWLGANVALSSLLGPSWSFSPVPQVREPSAGP